ncbi:hypothetical protein GCM10027343_29020 [Noviherbaspirillum agri]
MGSSDQQGSLVICVSPGLNQRWDVSEKGSEEPLASFDDKEDAYAYAIELTQSREGATVLVEDEEGFSPLALPDEQRVRQRRHGGAG